MNTVYKVHFTLYYASLTCIYVFAHNFLNIQWIFNPKKVLKSWELGLFSLPSNPMYVEDIEDYFDRWHLRHALIYTVLDEQKHEYMSKKYNTE